MSKFIGWVIDGNAQLPISQSNEATILVFGGVAAIEGQLCLTEMSVQNRFSVMHL